MVYKWSRIEYLKKGRLTFVPNSSKNFLDQVWLVFRNIYPHPQTLLFSHYLNMQTKINFSKFWIWIFDASIRFLSDCLTDQAQK